MYWSIYILSSLLISRTISTINKKYHLELFFFCFVIFITPTTIEVSNLEYAPSLFTFFFNLLLEQNFSLRPLRPLVITVPISIVLILLLKAFRKKFF